MINTESFFDELEKIAFSDVFGDLYTPGQVAMLSGLPGGYPQELEDEEAAVEQLRKTPEWQREDNVAGVGRRLLLGGTALGALGGAVGGYKLGRRIGMPVIGAVTGYMTGGLLGAKGGSVIQEKMIAKALKKYDAGADK